MLEGGLAHRVRRDVKFVLLVFNGAKEVANGLALLRNPELVVDAAVLLDLHLTELASQTLNELESILLHVDELKEVEELDFIVIAKIGL